MTGEPFVTERDLAATFDGSPYDDTWAALEQYRRVQAYTSLHPEQGYVAVSNALGTPQGRTRSWADDGRKPLAQTAIETAADYGWLSIGYDDPIFQGLNALVANVFSGGYIPADRWEAFFVLNERGYDSHVLDAFELVGVDPTEATEDRPNAAPRIRPAEDAALLGRCLSILGAPRGQKAQLETLSLPNYLEDAPEAVRELFVQCYVTNRGVPGHDSAIVQINEERPREYQRDLAVLIESVADEPVRLGDATITISADAARALGVAETLA